MSMIICQRCFDGVGEKEARITIALPAPELGALPIKAWFCDKCEP